MSKSYDTAPASATWVDPTGQMEYTVEWYSDGIYMSGVNLNDGTEWESPTPVDNPERFGPTTTESEFFAWVAAFVRVAS